MLIHNVKCYYIIYDDTIDGDTQHTYNWGGYYYVVSRLAGLLQKGMIKRYAEIRETDSHEVVLKVDIQKEVKA